MAETLSPSAGLGSAGEPVIHRIGVNDVTDALQQGWRDFLEVPTQLIFLALIYPVIGLVLGVAASGGDLLPIIWPLTAGFALLGPVAALGIYEMSRRREQGLPVSWTNGFDVFRAAGIGSILGLGLLLLGLFGAWVGTALWIYRTTIGPDHVASLGELWRITTATPEGHRLILIGNLVGLGFAVVAFLLTAVSFPLLLERDVGPTAAIRTSVRAVMANPVPMGLWGLIVAGLLFLGSLPLFVGLAVVMPVLGHATWHIYRKVVQA